MVVSAPCKNCTERELGCHSVCKRYKQFQKDNETERITIRNCKNIGMEHTNYLRDRKIQRERSHR